MIFSRGRLEDMHTRREWLLLMEAALDAYKRTGNDEFRGMAEMCGEVSAMLKHDIETRDYSKRDKFLEKFSSIIGYK